MNSILTNLIICFVAMAFGANAQESLSPTPEVSRFKASLLLAIKGNAKEQGRVGFCYETGEGVEVDLQKAVEWYGKAAANGDAYAQLKLGICYATGSGVTKDESESIKLWKQAAENGQANAQELLGYAYLKGEGVDRDLSIAFRWFEVSALSGNASAQRMLGHLYAEEIGTKANAQEAAKWYLKAAQQGDMDAQQLLGFAFIRGIGVPKSEREAFNWCHKAALQGSLKAQGFIGLAYSTGTGVERDQSAAYAWWSVAKERGDSYSAGKLTQLFASMTDAEKISGEVFLAKLTAHQSKKTPFIALEFEGPGVSIEVPEGWYALNNGTLKLIDNLASKWLGQEHGNDKPAMLVSLADKRQIEDTNSNLLSVQFSPEVFINQREVAEANAAQQQIILDHWRTKGYDRLKKVAYYSRLIGDGEFVQAAQNWYAKIVIEVQMREDFPKKIKESFIHMSNKGVIMITFTYLPSAREQIIPIRDYVLESLRANTIKRTN